MEKISVWSNLKEENIILEGNIIKSTIISDNIIEDRNHINNGIFSIKKIRRIIIDIEFETTDNKKVNFKNITDKELDGKIIDNYYRSEMVYNNKTDEYEDSLIKQLKIQ